MNDVAPGTPLTIVEVPPPTFRSRAAAADSIDGGPKLVELLADAENALRRGEYGAAALQTDAAEVSALWALATHWRRRSVVALNGDAVVGLATVRVPLRESPDSARIRIGVASHARGHGVGNALIDVAERIAREEGRSRLRLRAPHVAGVPFDPSAGWIESPDGVGRVPAAAASSRFLTHHGWSLAGVERVSALDLQSGDANRAETLDAQISSALAAIEPEYALHVWSGPTPPEWLGGIANLSADLPGDAPTGHAAAGESAWDVNRVASNDVRIAAANRTALVVGVEHVPTGSLVAFSELHLWRDHPNRPALQGLTIVHPEHRGRRLGLLTKARLVRELRERAPECPGIVTWSPESDSRLVALGERLGFRPIGVEGVWTKTLEPLPEEPLAEEPGSAAEHGSTAEPERTAGTEYTAGPEHTAGPEQAAGSESTVVPGDTAGPSPAEASSTTEGPTTTNGSAPSDGATDAAPHSTAD